MKYTCPLCVLNPASHSLVEIIEKENTLYYYTCPSKAELYFDATSIINHYEGVLKEISENKQWVWIFDAEGFNLKHFLQIQVAIELAKLISLKFSKNLKRIIIINPTFYVSSTYNVIGSFLNEKIKSIIEINSSYKSVSDVIDKI
jgi:hypothetical protein